MKMKRIKNTNRIKIRIPLSTRSGHRIGTKKGKKGYDRKGGKEQRKFYWDYGDDF
jgi:hypothetical protein